MLRASGSTKAAGAQPIAAIHCSVTFLQGDCPGADVFAMSMQSMSAIETCIDRWAGTAVLLAGIIAIAVDCPITPRSAINNRLR